MILFYTVKMHDERSEGLKRTFKGLSQELWAKNKWLSWRTQWALLANKKGSNWTILVSLNPRLRERCGKYGLTVWLTRIRNHHWTRPSGLRGSLFSRMAGGKVIASGAEPKCSESSLPDISEMLPSKQSSLISTNLRVDKNTHVSELLEG